MAAAHYSYVERIPETIETFISEAIRADVPFEALKEPIGGTSIMYSHNTFPSMAQKYHYPMWDLPTCGILEQPERATIIGGSRQMYFDTKASYTEFANDLIKRIEHIGD